MFDPISNIFVLIIIVILLGVCIYNYIWSRLWRHECGLWRKENEKLKKELESLKG